MIKRIGAPNEKWMVLIALIGIAGLIFLYFYNPQDIAFFPRCPFYALTGYKCPGCGTLRAIHALLHFRILDAFVLNPLMIVSIPVIVGMLLSNKIAFNVMLGKSVAVIMIIYWIFRNVL